MQYKNFLSSAVIKSIAGTAPISSPTIIKFLAEIVFSSKYWEIFSMFSNVEIHGLPSLCP